MTNRFIWAALLSLSFLGSCHRYDLSVSKLPSDARDLASTYVGTPDPRPAPIGEKLLIDWRIPRLMVQEGASLRLSLLYWNYTEEIISYPIDSWIGYKVYRLVNEECAERKGLLTYKAEIVQQDGTVFKEWQHQLFVNLIDIQ